MRKALLARRAKEAKLEQRVQMVLLDLRELKAIPVQLDQQALLVRQEVLVGAVVHLVQPVQRVQRVKQELLVRLGQVMFI